MLAFKCEGQYRFAQVHLPGSDRYPGFEINILYFSLNAGFNRNPGPWSSPVTRLDVPESSERIDRASACVKTAPLI
jgi:hypothetical protein